MKKYLKLFIIGFLFLNIIIGVDKVIAVDEPIEIQKTEIERSEEKINKYCPSASNPNLVSICGRVTQATAQPQVLYDGTTAPSVSQVPVKGVSVYLYECDNTSRTCKRDGLLSHPFSSTSTNKDGVFHLVGRKLENNWVYSYDNQYTEDVTEMMKPREVNITNQSKKRYLVFKCGNYFQGIHVIPSYLDLIEIIHEVHCPKELSQTNDGEFLYVPPYLQFDFIGGVKLAAQMGIDQEDQYYPLQTGEHVDDDGDGIYDGIRTTVQAHYSKYANLRNSSVPVILEGGDPRFTSPDQAADKKQAIATAIGGGIFSNFLINLDLLKGYIPDKGAWWSEDCKEQYKGTGWVDYCNMTLDDLYTTQKYTTMTLLPAIPPTQSILYYRPLEIRNEISAYYQDHDDLAKYMGMMFSNCVGDVYKREWESTDSEEDKPDYPNCEWLKQCNEAVNYSGNANSLTTNGFAHAFIAPGSLDELELNMDPDTPVCLISGDPAPVLIKQIQRPTHIICQEYDPDTGKGMRLCDNGAYWNNYYLTNLGNNNAALKMGYAGENKEDSYNTGEGSFINLSASGVYTTDGATRGPEVNPKPMEMNEEGKKLQAGGQGAVSGTGDRSANNSGGALMEITSSDDASSTEIFTDFFSQPFEDDEVRKEISKGTPYYISSRPVAWGQYSKTNEEVDSIITSGSHDTGVDIDGDGEIDEGGYLDPHAFSTEMECESCGKEHYTEDIFEDEIKIRGGKEWGGSRTPFEGISVTSTAQERVENLQKDDLWKDRIDTAISLSTGYSYIDWGMVKMKGRPDFGNTLGEIIQRFIDLFSGIFAGQSRNRNKTFADREPTKLNEKVNEDNFEFKDDLIAYGFKVNESNFKQLFGCPTTCYTSPECWPGPGTEEGKKAVKECYPWHSLPRGVPCETSTTECTDIPGTSRTCRVDKCESGTVTFTYDCGPIPVGGGPIELVVTNKEIVRKPGVCPNSISSCAFDPLTGVGDSPDDILPGICKPSQAGGKGFSTGPIYYDYCRVSRAGPNQCDGNILFDAEVATYSQTIDEQDNLNSPDSYNADEVPESGINFYKSFREPFTEDITPLPAAWVSVSSSLSETEPDVSLRKDFPGIGSGANFLTRAQFGQPQPIFQFTQLEPLYIHCENKDIVNVDGELGTIGTWDDGKTCDFAKLPEPEVIELEYLQRELDKIENPPCMLKEDLSACEQLLLSGTNSDGSPMELKFSETFKLVLNLAGNKMGVEPAAILAYMHKTGADKAYAYLWSEEGEKDLQEVTLPWYGAFPFCDDLEPVKQPPYDWKLSWFSEMFNTVVPGKDSPKGELMNLFNRQETASRCNFLDSTFALAGSIARNLVEEVNGEMVLISCPNQKWDNIMIEAMKTQYHQIQVKPEYVLKGTLGEEEVFTPDQEYQEIWNACR